VGLAAPGQSKDQHVLRAVEEITGAQRRELSVHLGGPSLRVERGQGFVGRKVGGLEQSLDLPRPSVIDLEFTQVLQGLAEGPPVLLCA